MSHRSRIFQSLFCLLNNSLISPNLLLTLRATFSSLKIKEICLNTQVSVNTVILKKKKLLMLQDPLKKKKLKQKESQQYIKLIAAEVLPFR